MNIWLNHVENVKVIGVLNPNASIPRAIDLPYEHPNISFIPIPAFNILTNKERFIAPIKIIKIIIYCFIAMKNANHIHLRCPGNVGLIGCFLQILFPHKTKTAKYAGNWDPVSKQPWSYRLQRFILKSAFLTKNMMALVYGNWSNNTKNIKPFYTASYSEMDRLDIQKSIHSANQVKLVFVGGLVKNKRPEIGLEVVYLLQKQGVNVTMTFCGDGLERERLREKVLNLQIQDQVHFLGNVSAEKVKAVLIESHFLIFISKSEGWPKAVAEAMWWGCIPITSPVSCVPEMVGFGKRGELLTPNPESISKCIINYICKKRDYLKVSKKAMEWSRQYTLERFEKDIKSLI
ncbi:glycosyltransferase family 4 protein [Flexithrix dorotheae]|uniref:glycosyltransferase family 4 protein n=1 Tax=Flexithrix dorotheae TaxID=70993 RepID=UPI0003A23643|nr:glycosyltransferase family 4 protein [Flexithrix dorotheae]